MSAQPAIVTESTETLWFLGTLARMKLDGAQTGGRFGLWEGVLPRGAAPPLHSHPQDETLYVLDGELMAWLADRDPGEEWVQSRARSCGVGTAVFAPSGTPHTFRVESDTARRARS